MSGGNFVETNHTATGVITLEDFAAQLRVQDVCSLSMHNVRQWYCEVPQELMAAYLRKRDHRHRGALLHKDALQLVMVEQEVLGNHSFAT